MSRGHPSEIGGKGGHHRLRGRRDISLGTLEAGGFGLTAHLEVSLPAIDNETAGQVVAQAHQVCPYSNATRGNMQVTLSVA